MTKSGILQQNNKHSSHKNLFAAQSIFNDFFQEALFFYSFKTELCQSFVIQSLHTYAVRYLLTLVTGFNINHRPAFSCSFSYDLECKNVLAADERYVKGRKNLRKNKQPPSSALQVRSMGLGTTIEESESGQGCQVTCTQFTVC
jgi:hypothetical protein